MRDLSKNDPARMVWYVRRFGQLWLAQRHPKPSLADVSVWLPFSSRPSAITATYWTCCKTKRQDDETEYQYRKRLLANTQDNNEDDIADDPNIETAISIKNSLHNIMRMTKQQLQQNISNSQETVDVLPQHTVF